LNRPGGNATGVINLIVELGSKQLGLLHELVPGATAIVLRASTEREMETMFATMANKASERSLLASILSSSHTAIRSSRSRRAMRSPQCI